MITPSFNLTATERVLPKLALDFTTAVLDPRVTFTRTTGASNPATYVNSSGLVTAATNNQPRFDFNPVTLVCRGLLIEEQRTNIALYSEQFDNLWWSKSACSVSANATIAPDGTLTADRLIADATNDFHAVYRLPIASAIYAISVYAKDNGYRFLQLCTTGSTDFANFDLQTGVLGTFSSGSNASITAVGNGWYRCSYVPTTNATAIQIGVVNASTAGRQAASTGNGVTGIFIWGAQLEAGAFATSYIPTTTAALTRNPDVATMTGTNFSDWFNPTEGSFAAWADGQNGGNNRIFSANDASAANRIMGFFNGLNYQSTMTTTSTAQASIAVALLSTLNTAKCISAYKANNFNIAANAVLGTTDTSCTVPTLTQLNLGSNETAAGNFLNGHISKIMYWSQRLTDAEVKAFSK